MGFKKLSKIQDSATNLAVEVGFNFYPALPKTIARCWKFFDNNSGKRLSFSEVCNILDVTEAQFMEYHESRFTHYDWVFTEGIGGVLTRDEILNKV